MQIRCEKELYSQQIVKEWICLPANIVEAKDVIACAQTLLMLRRSTGKAFPVLLHTISKVCAQAKEVITFEKLFDRLKGDSKFKFKPN